MSFNEAKFRSAAKAAGYSDEEIDAELGAPAGSVAPSAIASGPDTAAKFQEESDAKRAAIVQGFEESSKKDASTNPMTAQGIMSSNIPLIAGGALLGALTTYAAPKVYKSVKDRMMSKGPDAPVRIDPIGFESFADKTPTTAAPPAPAGQTNLTPQDLQAKLASLQQTPPATPVNAAPSGPNVPPQFAPGPVSPAGNIPPAPVPSYTPNSPITTKVSDTINDLMDKADAPKTTSSGPTVQSFARDANGNVMWPEKMSPAGREGAEAFMKQYPNHAAELAKEGRFGILGAGSGDNNLFNAYGADLRKTLLAELNNGQFVGEYENYKNKIAPAIRALPPETGLGKELADMRINDPKSANRGGLGVSGAVMPDKMVLGTTASKALKTGGKAFLGLAIADAANAATKGNTAPAKEVGFDLASGALLAKILGGPATIASALGLGSAGLNQGEEQDLAYRRKVGAGRGIAPPSAYIR